MPSSSNNIPVASVACRNRHWLMRYRNFILDPGTLFTLSSGLLLILAIISDPGGLFSHAEERNGTRIIYLAAALVGSSYIWWSALQGIRERDFTTDIPVSIATIAAIIIGEYSAAAVVAVLLLVGGGAPGGLCRRPSQPIPGVTRQATARWSRRAQG